MSRYSRSKSRRAELARKRRSNRRANSGLPGYDNLGWDHFGHPASSDQPSVDQYGFDSEFGEGVRKGPYRSGPAPASVGWEADHPAASDELVEDYALTEDLRQENLKKAMERKAAKCIRIAESRLGRNASQNEIEDLALRYMDLPNRTVNARVARLADNTVQVQTENQVNDFGVEADDHEAGLAQFGRGAEETEAHGMFDEYDIDGDEMISMDEWGGSDSVFDALDTNDDGFLSRDEIGFGIGDSFADEMSLEADDELATILAELEEEESVEASAAEALADEIATLKAANARLARKVRKLADDAAQVGTGYEGKDDSIELDTSADSEPTDGEPTQRLAKIERLADALSSYIAEKNLEADDVESDELATLLAELEGDQNDPHFGYTAEEVVEAEEADLDMGSDVMGLDMNADELGAMDPRLASIFTAAEEEEDDDDDSEEDSDDSDDSNDSDDDSKEEASDDDAKEETSKKASYRPRKSARKAAVKTLGNISREASSASDELSKLWESAPDVSKFFG